MQLQSKNINKVRVLLYDIFKYSFKNYFSFGSVSPFCIWQGNNICAWVAFDSIGNQWTVDSCTGHRHGSQYYCPSKYIPGDVVIAFQSRLERHKLIQFCRAFNQVLHQPSEVCKGLVDTPSQRHPFTLHVEERLLHMDEESPETG